jgi:hypothetical protein
MTTSVFSRLADTERQKEAHLCREHERSSGKEDTRPKGSLSSSNKGSRKKRRFCSLENGERPSIKKEMSTYSVKKFVVRTTIPLHI